MTESRVFLLCFVCLLSLYACDDDDGIPPANHGVSGSKELNELTQEEVDRICEDNRERTAELFDSSPAVRDSLRIGCTIAGLVSTLNGGTKAECEADRDQCIERLSRLAGDSERTRVTQIAIEVPCPPAATLNRCDARVSDFNACTNARLTASKNAIQEANEAMSEFSCNNAGQPFDSGVFSSIDVSDLRVQLPEATELPEVCASLLEQCPGVVVF